MLHKLFALGSKIPDGIAWNEDMDKEFEDLKIALTNNPILAAPDFSLPFILHTGRGIGGVLWATRMPSSS